MQDRIGHTAWRRIVLFSLVVALTRPANADSQTAQYRVTFESTWSAETHPIDFPPNPHFSSLIGGTHAASVHFWAPGELASQGIKDMAERGLTAPLAAEVQAAIDLGNAGVVIQGGGISPSPGSVNTTFTIDQSFPLVTLVSMIAPTPDWFVGVNSLPLFANGAWIYQTTVSLLAWDAGTDSGPNYTSPNQETIPREPIALNMSPPFASGTPLGTFTFTRIDASVSDTDGLLPGESLSRAVGWPNPFRSSTGVRFGLARPDDVSVRVFDARGRVVNVLHSGRLDAGWHYVPWNGKDSRGAAAGSGIYFIRVHSSHQARDAKVVRVQ